MAIAVRAAVEADLDELVRLNEPVQALHAGLSPRDFKPIADPAEVRAFLAAIMAKSMSILAIAEIDGRAAGYLWFERQPRPGNPFSPPRPRLYVHHLSVATDAQRRGVGTALMRHVEQRAIAEGFPEIALDTWAANSGARAFFAAAGFDPFNLVLRKRLGA